MLRSPTERLAIALCPGRIGVMRKRGRAEIEQGVVRYAKAATGDWQAAMDAFDAWLDKMNLRKAQASLLLSNRYVRYALIPWSALGLKRAEEDALVRVRFEEAYGDMAGWRIVADPGRYGSARIACALPADMVDRLHAQWAARQLRGGAILPHFVACWNRWRNPVGSKPALTAWDKTPSLFAVAESSTLVVGTLAPQGQGWTGLRALSADTASLPDTLYRESLLQGHAEPLPVRLHVPGLGQEEGTALLKGETQGAAIELLQAEPQPQEAALAMARLGVGMGWLK
ncbi:MAG: hypothetical protein EKK46_02650 [Rhodocyclaceae bacterium]|nr:MAG: hypothetical protein EKK46_02650 [Rhodocyclaceae bacterium]